MNYRFSFSIHIWACVFVVVHFFPACAELELPSGPSQPVPSIMLPIDGKEDGYGPVDPEECPNGAPHLPNGRPAAWTVIHLSASDNDLEDYIVEDIDEMERGHGGTEQVNVLVQLDRLSEDGTWRYQIQPDSNPGVVDSPLVGHTQMESDTGNWQTLASFGEWAITCYPAENYFVIISGHASGWSGMTETELAGLSDRTVVGDEPARVIAPDDTNGTELRIPELVHALRVIRDATRRPNDPSYLNRLTHYGSDACLMQTIEVLYDLRNTAEYIIGSEEMEPVAGWPYNTFLRDLTQRPHQYAQQPNLLGQRVVEFYGSSYTPSGAAGFEPDTTLSVVNSSFLIRARNRMRRFSEIATDLLQDQPELVTYFTAARSSSVRYLDEYVDLVMFLRNLRSELIISGRMPEVGELLADRDERMRSLREAIDALVDDVWGDLVPAIHAGPATPDVGGVSIFLPQTENTLLTDYGR